LRESRPLEEVAISLEAPDGSVVANPLTFVPADLGASTSRRIAG
jgi:hypothetical protein